MSYLLAVADYWKLHATSALKSAIDGEDAQGLVEYALILVLVAVVVIAVLRLIGPEAYCVFDYVWKNIRGDAGASLPYAQGRAACMADHF